MSPNAFQASASPHQPRRLVITDEESLEDVHMDGAVIVAPVADLAEVEQ